MAAPPPRPRPDSDFKQESFSRSKLEDEYLDELLEDEGFNLEEDLNIPLEDGNEDFYALGRLRYSYTIRGLIGVS
ncbi:hypothetical protein Tco_0722308 [Tanacetum coccineum]